MQPLVIPLAAVSAEDVELVGGKNASLGEMIRHLDAAGVSVPGGFAITAHAFRRFMMAHRLDALVAHTLADLDVEDVSALQVAGRQLRAAIASSPLPAEIAAAVDQIWNDVFRSARNSASATEVSVAMRSSATAEDLPEASFAGQQETLLNIRGCAAVKARLPEVFGSLFTDRAIAYRVHQGFAHTDVALSVGVQQMVRSDCGSSGVMFTVDTESGFTDAILLTASYGLGELVVQGAVNPDEFLLYKPALRSGKRAILRRTLGSKTREMVLGPSDSNASVLSRDVELHRQQRFSLTDSDIESLGQMALAIADHYGCAMDIEWARDGLDGRLYIVQARPETVHARGLASIETFTLRERGRVLTEGRAIGTRIGAGIARRIDSPTEMAALEPGEVLVADMTDPDWEPIMKRASAIVTNRGGRTCHAAIIARELGVPAVVGCGDATKVVANGMVVTVSCAEGDRGQIYEGRLPFDCTRQALGPFPAAPVKIKMNIADPERAFMAATIPNDGVGLARLEFIVGQMVGIHPRALLEPARLAPRVLAEIARRTAAWGGAEAFYKARIEEGVASIAAAFAPHPVTVRLTDFKSNEYARLLGGDIFEPIEENPMLGFRGAARYVAPEFAHAFSLECAAIRYVREEMGLTNVEVMVPFVRTVEEAAAVVEQLSVHGLVRGEHGLRLIMMCELPVNALLADAFLDFFDGFSIGSNDLTQLTLGIDRDSALVAQGFDERNPAVLALMEMAIRACRKRGRSIGICGQGPSDHPSLARWLVDAGVDALSLNPDAVLSVRRLLAGA